MHNKKRSQAKWRSQPQSSFTVDLADIVAVWPGSQIVTIPQWLLLWSGSQIIDCNYHFCDNCFIILLPSPASKKKKKMLEQPWNNFSFVKGCSEGKLHITIISEGSKYKSNSCKTGNYNHLAARAKSRSVWSCEIHLQPRSSKNEGGCDLHIWQNSFAICCWLQLHQSKVC